MSLPYIYEYNNKLIFADEAAMTVQSGDWVYYAFGGCSYSDLVTAVAERQGELQDVKICSDKTDTIYHIMDFGPNDKHRILNPSSLIKYWRDFDRNDKSSRVEAQQVSILGQKNRIPNIIFMATVSPMDQDGYFGLSGSSLFDHKVLQIAQTVILEVNENICRLSGANQNCIHISRADYVVPSSNAPLMPFDEVPKRHAFKINKQRECGRFTISKAL